MESDLNCPLCQDQYTDQNPPRLLAVCGHTYCQKCLTKILTEKDGSFQIICPQDFQIVTLKQKSLNGIPKNIALLKIIESKKKNSSFKDPELEMSKITKNQEYIHEDEEAQDLVDAIGFSNSGGSEQKIVFDKQQLTKIESGNQKGLKIQKQRKCERVSNPLQMCKVHQKPLQVVCIIDLKRICVNCAIFGQHKGHDFKSLEEIENHRMSYYTEILQVMEKKENVSSRISNEETCSSIMELLSNKKQKVRNSINEKYKKLLETIETKQKESLKNLDTLMSKTQSKLKNLMKIDAKIMERYDDWEEKSYQQIKILEGQDFEAKLKLLFFQPSESIDVVETGENIINQMHKHQQNMLNQVELALQNIGVEFNLEIFNHIDNFVEIFQEVKRKKSKPRMKTQIPNSQNAAIKSSSVPAKKQDNSETKDEILEEKVSHHFTKSTKDIVHHHQEDLLEIESNSVTKKPQFIKSLEISIPNQKTVQSISRREDIVSPSSKIFEKTNKMTGQKSPRMTLDPMGKKQESSFFAQDKIVERPNKKKLSKVKWPEKYQKIIDGIANDQLETIDLTNAQLGDANILLISQFINGSRAKTVKFIRNKLTDDSIAKILPYMRGVATLNISQNLLTQRVLDILIEGRSYLQSMKSIILSQNKIMQRKAKPKLDKLKSLDLTISI